MMEILGTIGILVVLAVLVGAFLLLRKRPKRINLDHFQEQWANLQKQCRDKEAWKNVVVEADKLLDTVLKKKRFTGKTMGERLVKAQRLLSDNDSVWFGHKLRNKIENEPDLKLKEADVKQALLGIRQALKDLGALPGKQQQSSEESKAPKENA